MKEKFENTRSDHSKMVRGGHNGRWGGGKRERRGGRRERRERERKKERYSHLIIAHLAPALTKMATGDGLKEHNLHPRYGI